MVYIPRPPHFNDWIWTQPDWPHFVWQAEALTEPLRQVLQAQGELFGRAQSAHEAEGPEALDALLQNLIASSAIEGETLNAESVRSSLAHRLGVAQPAIGRRTAQTEGLAELIVNVTGDLASPLTPERLFHWHALLFADAPPDAFDRLRIGAWRGDSPMRVVSGRLDAPTIHYQAPPREGLEAQMATFFDWFNTHRTDASLDPVLRAGIAHLYFVTLHPFEDGNGRLARAIADLALAQSDQRTIRLFACAASILARRKQYYDILEQTQRGPLDITPWLAWFLSTLLDALHNALAQTDSVLAKARFWRAHADQGLNEAQVKVLNRLLAGGEGNFPLGISAAQYQTVAKVSKATATRHLAELVEKGCLRSVGGGGRSRRYGV